MSDILSAAVAYATRGMFIIPALFKRPAVRWQHLQGVPPTVIDVHRQFAGRFSNHNIACIHGAASGTVLLDWDWPDGFASQRQLEAELGPLPETPTVLSGGGGTHELYRHPGVHVPTRKGLREGFDVRGDGGISILPPSIHETGKEYEWECDKSLDDMPLATLPSAWVEFVTADVSSNQFSPDEEVVWQQDTDGSRIVTDGRETYMRDVVWNAFQSFNGMPTVQQLYDKALPEYMTHIDTSKPGRGSDEVWTKCNDLVRKQSRIRQGLKTPFLNKGR